MTSELRLILDEAEAFVTAMPSTAAGRLFLRDGKVVQPDITSLESYQPHAGQRRGHRPTDTEILEAMFERYRKPD